MQLKTGLHNLLQSMQIQFYWFLENSLLTNEQAKSLICVCDFIF
jgi:hypothetical protein